MPPHSASSFICFTHGRTSASDVQTSQVISLADWSDGTLTSLKPHAPEPTGTVVVFDQTKH